MTLLARETIRERLEAWLTSKWPDYQDVRVANLRMPLGTGNSAETWFVDISYRSDGEHNHRPMVVRRQLQGSDFFLNADLNLPYQMMQAFQRHPSVPVPRPLAIEFNADILGSPFLLMEALPGRVVDQAPNYNVQGWVADLAPAQRHALWLNGIEAMAKIRRIDWRQGFEFLSDPKRGAPGLDQYLDWIKEWYFWARADRPQPVADVVLNYLLNSKPQTSEVCVLWGDANPGNMVFSPDAEVVGLLDFEMAALGPGEVDLAWWLFFDDFWSVAMGIERLAGLPTKEETIAHYVKVSGKPVSDLDYYMLLSLFKMNTVGIRTIDRMMMRGLLANESDALTHNPLTKMMAIQLSLPVPEPGEGFAKVMAASVKVDA